MEQKWANFWWNFDRYLVHTSEQPPHCHFLGFRLMLLSHEHSVRSPLEQARVIDHANAAEFMAWIYAVSRLSKSHGKHEK